MTYAEYLRKREKMDDYILLLLSLKLPLKDGRKQLGVYQVAKQLHLSHQTIYNCIERNKDLVEEYIGGF